MTAADGGWWHADAPTGTDYAYLLDDDDTPLPDPAVAVAARRRARAVPPLRPRCVRVVGRMRWTGRSLPGGVLYELHIGTFTPGGTFDSALERLDHLVDLGITFVEVLPVNSFDGTGGLGLRRGAVGCGARAVRRPGRVQAVRRRVPRAWAWLSCWTSSTTTSGRPARTSAEVRPVLRRPERLGSGAEPGRPGLRRGPSLRHRQRAGLAARLPRRRAAAGRRARVHRPARDPPAGGTVRRGRRAVRGTGQAVDPDRRVRPERPAAGHAARGRRRGRCTRSGPTTCTTRCTWR